MKKNLTLHFCLHEMVHFAASAGIVSFAATYLLGKGFPATLVGTILAGAGFLSCLTQPFLASLADRASGNALPAMMTALAVTSALCFGSLLLLPLPVWAVGILYLLGYWSFDTIVPLMNSVSVYYQSHGIPINYGLARGTGSLAHSLSALLLGYLIALLGVDWMIIVVLLLLAVHIVLTLGYPKITAEAASKATVRDESCSVGVFLKRYRWFCLSLLGILLMGMFLSMVESYMISIMERLGGDSSHVGTALFIATIAEFPVLACIGRIRKRLADSTLLVIAAASYTLRSVLLLAAGSIPFLYGQQLLQMTSYAIMTPVQVYYTMSRVAPEDMVKGQAFVSAAYALGCGFGNMAGGFLVENYGVAAMLRSGVLFTALGTLVLLFTVRKSDFQTCEKL
ncbi:MAG: MFS transporter [Oscillospiraceae bacterium]|nr:MFS transporter [Oscillospiraceae bacterium]